MLADSRFHINNLKITIMVHYPHNTEKETQKEKLKTPIEKFLDFLGAICIIVFFGSIILKIWLPDDVQYLLNRLWLTALLTFFFIIIFYGFVCYKSFSDEV